MFGYQGDHPSPKISSLLANTDTKIRGESNAGD